MRQLTADQIEALNSDLCRRAEALIIRVRNRDTDAIEEFAFWNGTSSVTMSYIDPYTRTSQTADFKGAGSLIQISPIASGLSNEVQTVDFVLSGIEDAAIATTYDAKMAKVIVLDGILGPSGATLIGDLYPMFVGTVDKGDIEDGEVSTIKFTASSQLHELKRADPSKRSKQTVVNRNANDKFGKHRANVHKWALQWGGEKADDGGGSLSYDDVMNGGGIVSGPATK